MNSEIINYIIALSPSAASIVSIIAAVVRIGKSARKNDTENYERFTRIAGSVSGIVEDIGKLKEEVKSDKDTIKVLISENERLLKELKAEREARTGVKED